MKIPFCNLHRQYLALKDDIDHAIKSVIKESAFIRGFHVDQFEKKFAKLIGISHCISCANGTDAIYIVLKGLGIRPGDEVITTAHSWISTSETITQAGARVVFVDTEPDTYCIDPGKIEEKITKKTKAIIPVHLYGQPADMDPILVLAKKYGLKVVEDCAQSHLAKYKGRIVGTFGDAATFSFYPGKNLGAMGDAGCIVTNNQKLARFCTLYARHGGKNQHIIEGVNSRMDGLQAAILNVKMDSLKKWNHERQKIADYYSTEFSKISSFSCPITRSYCEHVFHLYVIKTKKRNELIKHCQKYGVTTQINYPKALPFNKAYLRLKYNRRDIPVAYSNQKEILSLPIFPYMKENEINFVIKTIKSFFFKK